MVWEMFRKKSDAQGNDGASSNTSSAGDQRIRESRRVPRPIPVPEVVEGNEESDWEMWRDSVAFHDSQFSSSYIPTEPMPLTPLEDEPSSSPELLDNLNFDAAPQVRDAFSSVTKKRG